MAERRPRARRQAVEEWRGPWVQVAAFADNVVEGNDGTASLIRLIDTFQVAPLPPDVPEVIARQAAITANMFIGLKSGDARGAFTIQVRHTLPDGAVRMAKPLEAVFSGGEFGVNVRAQLVIEAHLLGLHWFNVLVDDHLLTRLPMRVREVEPARDATLEPEPSTSPDADSTPTPAQPPPRPTRGQSASAERPRRRRPSR